MGGEAASYSHEPIFHLYSQVFIIGQNVNFGLIFLDLAILTTPLTTPDELIFAPSNGHIHRYSAQTAVREYYSKPTGNNKALSGSQAACVPSSAS